MHARHQHSSTTTAANRLRNYLSVHSVVGSVHACELRVPTLGPFLAVGPVHLNVHFVQNLLVPLILSSLLH